MAYNKIKWIFIRYNGCHMTEVKLHFKSFKSVVELEIWPDFSLIMAM